MVIMRQILIFVLDLIIRGIIGILIFNLLFIKIDLDLGTEYHALLGFSLILFALFSCLLENIIENIFLFFLKWEGQEYIIITFTSFLAFLSYWYVLVLKNKHDAKLREFLFVTFLMLLGSGVRLFLSKIRK